MKVLLVNPPNCGKSTPEDVYGIQNIKRIFRGEPLALEELAGNLSDHHVAIVDLKVTPDRLWDEVARFEPDVVGITGVTCEANTVIRMAGQIKERSSAVVVVGGHHASCDPHFFNCPHIDYVVVGLGKLSFRQLVEALDRKLPPETIPGIGKTSQSGLKWTPRRFTQADLVDSQPTAYHLVAAHRDQYVMSGVGGKVGFVASAFGCTHRCTFCAIPNITGNRYLTRSVEAVLRDIERLGDVPLIRLVDANTFGNVDMAKSLGQQLLHAGLNKHIVADVRADTVVKHPEVFELWKQAGLVAAVIGFEEISDTRLESFGKKSNVATNVQAIKRLKEMGIRIIGDFIVSPDYEVDDFKQLEDFVNTHDIDLPLPAILTPIPGTPLHKRLKDQITITDLDYYTFSNAVLPTKMAEDKFYQTYSDLLKTFLNRITH